MPLLTCVLGTFLTTEIRQKQHSDLVKTFNQTDHPILKYMIEPTNCTDRALFHGMCRHYCSVQRCYGSLPFWHLSKRPWFCHVLVLLCLYHAYFHAVALV